jgi:ACS family glucarate transporter-like MFS transporter
MSTRASVPVRLRVLGVLLALSFVNYLLRNNLSVAAASIQTEYRFNNEQLSWIFFAFNLAYTVFQIPGGMFGEWLGPRRLLAGCALAWGVVTLASGWAPGLALSAGGALGILIAVRFLMGVANAPLFPVCAAAIANWFPMARWAFPNAALSTGLTLGQAAVGPAVIVLILEFGWRASFYWLAPLGFIAAAWWWWYGRDTPAEHASVSAEERALVAAGRATEQTPARPWQALGRVLRNRNILLLTASYFCMNVVFYIFSNWLFLYLVRERHFTALDGGWLYALPFVVGAVFATLGGLVCDGLCRRVGARWGCRLPGLVGMVLVAVLLLMGAAAPNPYIATGLLALCFGCTQFTEGSYWQGCTLAAGAHTAAATGVLNTGGNLAGFLAPAVGYMLDHFGWLPTLECGSAFALLSAVLWLLVRVGTTASQA